MKYMNLYDLCEQNAEEGLDYLIEFLETRRDLIYTKEESENIVSIDIETLDNENYSIEFLMCCEFTEDGEFIKSV